MTPIANLFVTAPAVGAAGSLVREFDGGNGAVVRTLLAPGASDGPARDLAVAGGKVHVFDGTASPQLSSYDVGTDGWTSFGAPGWDTVSNISSGGIALGGGFVYVTDSSTAAGPASGLLRFDPATGVSVRFAEGTSPIDVAVGGPGWIYTLDPDRMVRVYRPDTLGLIRQHQLPESIEISAGTPVVQDYRAIAVDGQGQIFTADWNRTVARFVPSPFSADLQLRQATVAGGTNPANNLLGNLIDLDLDPDSGWLAVGSTNGTVGQMSQFAFSNAYYFGAANGPAFVAYSDPLVAVDIDRVTITEGQTPLRLNVTLTRPSATPVTLTWDSFGNTAIAGSDFVAGEGSIRFDPGQTAKTIDVTILNDSVHEPTEYFYASLNNLVGASYKTITGVGTILDDEPAPTVGVADAAVTEGGPGTTIQMSFQVSLSSTTYQAVSVQYETVAGTADAADFDAASGSVTFAAGERFKTVLVTVKGDNIYEPEETFTLRLKNPSAGVTLGDFEATGFIRNDDSVPTLSVSSTAGTEGGAPVGFTLGLSNPSSQPVNVFLTSVNQTATGGLDFTPLSAQQVTFAPGETSKLVQVAVLDDSIDEPAETFKLEARGASGALLTTATGTINDNDPPPAVTLALSGSPLAEGGGVATVTATLSEASGQAVTVNLGFTGTAGNPADYTRSGASIVIPAGSTSGSVTLTAVNDALDETNETIVVDITAVTNGTESGTQQVTATIADDDPATLTLSIAKDWSFQTVDSAGDVGAWSSLQIGSDNRPRIAYEDRSTSSRNLKYASFDGVSWNTETVHDDPTDTVGQYASLALDSLNRPHIAYQHFHDTHLRYAHHNGTAWVLETANTNSYLHIAIDLDSQNRPLVSSFDGYTWDLDLARRSSGGVWSVESPLNTTSPHGWYTALAVDAADNPWIAFVDGFSGPGQTLKLARFDGAAWQFQTVATGSNFRDSSLVLDSSGHPHVSYYDSGALKYAFFNGTAWTRTTVDANNAGEHNSLALDSVGRPRIAYIGSGAARFASFDGNSWTTQFVGAQADYTSLALDENDLASISYYSTATRDLVLASQITASMSENGGSRTATVTRADTAGEVTVNLLSGDTTEATVVASVVLADGQATSAPFPINAVDDFVHDGTQTVTVTASAAGYLGDSDAVNVTDDDPPGPPAVTLGLVGSPLAEGGGAATVTATLSAASGQAVTVDLGFTGTAGNPADYTRSGASIVIPAGSATGSVTLTGVDDVTDEANETITVDIVGVTNGIEAGTQQVTATITDDDPTPAVSVGPASVAEGDTGATSLAFTLTLSNPSAEAVTVNYATADGTARAGSDYTAAGGSVTFAPGETSKSVAVAVTPETDLEADETLDLRLSLPAGTNATLDTPTAVGTIRNDDFAPVADAGPDQPADEGAAARFDGSGSSDPDGDPLTYTWDFGDGQAGTGVSPTHAYADNGTFTVTLTVSDGHGGTSTDTAVVTVGNVAPVAGVGGPTTGVRGQARTFTLTATDPSAADRAAPFAYRIDWGDGTTGTASGPAAGTPAAHAYAVAGTYTVQVWATDKDGAEGAVASRSYTVKAVEVQNTDLVVGGTTGNDTILVTATPTANTVTVAVNGAALGTFTAAGQLVVYAQAGDDRVSFATRKVSGTTYRVNQPLLLFGEGGNDTLDARNAGGPAVLVGGAGNDVLWGSRGRTVLIGGAGADDARGGDAEDVVIGGTTRHDADPTGLAALRAEWARTDAGYATRRDRLLGVQGGGFNGAYVLSATGPAPTVQDDGGTADTLFGYGGQDWYFAAATDRLGDRQSNETVTGL